MGVVPATAVSLMSTPFFEKLRIAWPAGSGVFPSPLRRAYPVTVLEDSPSVVSKAAPEALTVIGLTFACAWANTLEATARTTSRRIRCVDVGLLPRTLLQGPRRRNV